MKKVFIFISCVVLYTGLRAQELRDEDRSIPAVEQKSTKEIAAELFPLSIDNTPSGPFSVQRFAVPINLIDIDPSGNEYQELDILAVSRAKEQNRRSQIRSINTAKQLDQIKAQVRVFLNQDQQQSQDIYNRANNNLNYNKRTPDGGIRNEAMRDIRQPFMNPYYNYGRRGYYYGYPGYYWR